MPATQSSTYENYFWASRANDGNVNPNMDDGSCSHTNFNYEPWARFDMLDVKGIRTVVLINRLDCCSERLKGYRIFATNSTNPADYKISSKR